MKKSYMTPKLTVHGSVENLTQQTKKFGANDGIILDIPGTDGVPIGSV